MGWGARELTESTVLLDEKAAIPFDRQALALHLRQLGWSFDANWPIRQFAGGLANRNYLVEVNGQPMVLRRPPDGDLPAGAHDMAREHSILLQLWRIFPLAPRSVHFCADVAVLGAPFQLIEYRPGLVIPGGKLEQGPQAFKIAELLSEHMIATLASIHSCDIEPLGLGGLGRPKGFVSRAIAGWKKRGLRLAGSPAMTSLIEDVSCWLERRSFAERPPRLLHCDFKLNNMILDPETLAPRAVLDWGMGTQGDPLFDLATTLSYWAQPDDPECLRSLGQMPTTAPGFKTRSQAAARYAELTGFTLDDLPALRVLATLNLGIVFLQLHEQWARGAVSDQRYADFRGRGEEIVVFARDIVQQRAE